MLITIKYGNMRNTNKTVIYIPKLRAGRYLFLFHTRWLLFKSLIDLKKIVEIKENFTLTKKTEMLKICKSNTNK